MSYNHELNHPSLARYVVRDAFRHNGTTKSTTIINRLQAVKSNTPAPDAAESDEELQLSPEELELMSALDNDVEQEDADDEAAPLDDADAWEIDEETLAQLDREGLLMDESSEDDIQVWINSNGHAWVLETHYKTHYTYGCTTGGGGGCHCH